MYKNYNWKKGLTKALISVGLITVPLLIDVAPTIIEQYSTVFDLTLGGILIMGLNYLKVYLNNKQVTRNNKQNYERT